MDEMLLLEIVGFFAATVILYVLFMYWYASRNRRIDKYVKPQISWLIRTALMALGTVVTVFLFQPITLFGTLYIAFGFQIPNNFVFGMAVLSLVMIPLMLFVVLIGVAMWPGIFVVVWALLQIILTVGIVAGNTMVQAYYLCYILLGMFPIFLSLFTSSRYAVNALITRLRRADYPDVADRLETNGRIGIGAFVIGVLLPTALFTRWVRRGTKTGRMKIALSVTFGSRYAYERGVEVELPEDSA